MPARRIACSAGLMTIVFFALVACELATENRRQLAIAIRTRRSVRRCWWVIVNPGDDAGGAVVFASEVTDYVGEVPIVIAVSDHGYGSSEGPPGGCYESRG